MTKARTWPVIEIDLNTSPRLFDVVTVEAAEEMLVGAEVLAVVVERQEDVALTFGLGFHAVVTKRVPTGDRKAVVVYVQPT